MPYCAWCGQEVAVISYAPCPHCGKSANGAPPRSAPVAAGGGSNVAVIVIAVVVGGLIVIAIAGIIAAIAIPNLLTATQRAKQKRTMADMRTIGIAIESRAADTAGDIPNVSNIDDLRPLLVPKYVNTLPTKDGWGRPFRYACVAEEQGRCTSFAIGSAGKDGVFETNDLREAVQSPRGGTTNFDCDIIFKSPEFIEYPEGVQH